MLLRATATTDAAIGSTWTDIGDSADRELLLLSLCGLCRTRHRGTLHTFGDWSRHTEEELITTGVGG